MSKDNKNTEFDNTNKKLIERLIKISNEIYKNRKPNANYIHLSEDFIQQQADERKISFDDMVEIIKKRLLRKKFLNRKIGNQISGIMPLWFYLLVVSCAIILFLHFLHIILKTVLIFHT